MQGYFAKQVIAYKMACAIWQHANDQLSFNKDLQLNVLAVLSSIHHPDSQSYSISIHGVIQGSIEASPVCPTIIVPSKFRTDISCQCASLQYRRNGHSTQVISNKYAKNLLPLHHSSLQGLFILKSWVAIHIDKWAILLIISTTIPATSVDQGFQHHGTLRD